MEVKPKFGTHSPYGTCLIHVCIYQSEKFSDQQALSIFKVLSIDHLIITHHIHRASRCSLSSVTSSSFRGLLVPSCDSTAPLGMQIQRTNACLLLLSLVASYYWLIDKMPSVDQWSKCLPPCASAWLDYRPIS